MPSIEDLLTARHDAVMERWTERAAEAASARGLSGPETANLMSGFLDALASAARGAEHDKRIGRYLDEHLGARMRQGFQLAEMVEELAILGRTIGEEWLELPEGSRPPAAELREVLARVQQSIGWITDAFEAHMRQDEQADKRAARRLEIHARRALVERANPTEAAPRLLETVRDAMECRSATLVLFDAETARLVEVATAPVESETFEQYATSLTSRSIEALMAREGEGATELTDVTTSDLEVSPALRASGVHSVLGVRLPPHAKLFGVLYVGLTEKRAFTGREVRRLEMLAERVLVHVEMLRLHHELSLAVGALEQERALRERFVSLLAHDLRTPLSTAKMAASALLQQPADDATRVGLASRIVRSVDRADRLLRDLLDVSRVAAGASLPLTLAEVDLADVARAVVSQLGGSDGGRVTFHGEPVRGWWDASELERALENLVTNALKYGDPTTPVSVTLERDAGLVRLAVHNRGAPLSRDQCARVFEPFVQEAAGRGWGLGLTLVRACAEAHGGHVQVDSDPVHGTTFQMELPLDARAVARTRASDLAHP